jgi:small-conductance mechanosensitive channel
LTAKINADYSVANPFRRHLAAKEPENIASMLEQFDSLETKLSQLIARYQAAREENLRLRQQVLAMENANKQLTERLAEARSRVETLFNQLPEE